MYDDKTADRKRYRRLVHLTLRLIALPQWNLKQERSGLLKILHERLHSPIRVSGLTTRRAVHLLWRRRKGYCHVPEGLLRQQKGPSQQPDVPTYLATNATLPDPSRHTRGGERGKRESRTRCSLARPARRSV